VLNIISEISVRLRSSTKTVTHCTWHNAKKRHKV